MANYTPLGANRKWPGMPSTTSELLKSKTSEEVFRNGSMIPEPENFVGKNFFLIIFSNFTDSFFKDTNGEIVVKAAVTGACRKCGFIGHLAFQCRNFIKLDSNRPQQIDISSTSSEEEYETPLTSKKGCDSESFLHIHI